MRFTPFRTAIAAAVLAAVAFAAVLPAVYGQAEKKHKWQAGETVEVYSLNPDTHQYEWRKGVVKDVMSWGGAHVTYSDRPGIIENIGEFDSANADSTPPGINAARYIGYKRGPLTTQGKASAAGICPCDPGIQNKPGFLASREAIFKHLIWENYNATVNGTLSSPLKVGVTFDTFRVGAPHSNSFGAIGGGARGLEHSTAKQGEKIYPISTHYTLWRQYRNALTKTVFEGRFDGFKEKSGGWVCPTAPGHQQIGSTH